MSAINKEKPPKVNPNGIKVKMKTKAKSNNLLNYPFGEVVIPDTDLTPDAFIYKFLHILTGRWYIGMHGLKEHESPFDGTYWNSSATYRKFTSGRESFCSRRSGTGPVPN